MTDKNNTPNKTVNETAAENTSSKAVKRGYWERNRLSDGYLLRKDIGKIAVKVGRFLLLFGMCFLILQPIFNKISVSFMEERDLYDSTIINIPVHFTTENYELAMSNDLMDYWNTLRNTVIQSLLIAVLQIVVCTLVGYGFARFKFPLKKLWFACVILIILVPPQTISTSLHLHFRYFDIFGIISAINGEGINLRGSKLPYYLMSAGCMGLKNGLYIFMIRQYFRNIPKDMEEAAYVDGCGTLRTFIRIMLPDAKPIITSCFLFAFVWQWTDKFYAQLFMGGTRLLGTELVVMADRLGAYLQRLLGSNLTSAGYLNCMVSTCTLLVIAPLIVLYLFAQKGFVESLASTGVKG